MAKALSSNSKSLVLVIGAGASKEVNLPVGNELRMAIASSLGFRVEKNYNAVGGDPKIIEVFSQLAQQTGDQSGDINPYLRAAALIRDAMPQAPSIDNFIDSHRSDIRVAQCGKLAIVSCILKAERTSSLRVDRKNIYNKIKFAEVAHTWFNGFFQLIVQNCQRDEIPARLQRITVISFNYDRCLEHFLHGSLQNYYSMTSEQASETLNHLHIFHPYGTVGPLPWAKSGGIDYGGEPHYLELGNLSNQIRTFTEGTDDTASNIVTIRSILRAADQVAFLGFAFHPLNLELLYGAKQRKASVCPGQVYATALGLSNSDVGVIAEDLAFQGGYRPENITLNKDLTAAQLFNEYSRSLSLR
ncbi:MAG: hypothetical protein ACYCY1_08570 [Sulfuriferula sp.]